MSDERKWIDGLKVLTAAGLLLTAVAGCDGELLDVTDPDNVQPTEELTPGDVQPRLAGMINEFRTSYDFYTLYTGLLTDEFILAGTFPTRREVDQRNPISQNVSINGDVWQPLSVTRAVSDQTVDDFSALSGTEEFASVQGALETGIAWGNLLAGYSRLFLAEMFCHSILGGGTGDIPRFVDEETVEDAPLSSADRARDALSFFEEAEARASEFGNEQVRLAALMGQARAHMFLHSLGSTTANHLTEANAAAEEVWTSDNDFTLAIEYSGATPGEENEIFQQTWGINAALRWTVGDGADDSRGFERFAHYGDIPEDEEGNPDLSASTGWVGQGLLIPPFIAETDANLAAFNRVSPVSAQTLYAGRSGQQSDISVPLATAWEARVIMAEVALREGRPGDAESMVNPLLEDESQGLNPMTAVNAGLTAPPGPGDFTSERLEAFEPVSLDDGEPLAENLADLAYAYEAGLWATSHRHHYLRRMAEEFDDRFFPRNAVGGNYGDPDNGGNAKNFPLSVANGSLWPDHAFPQANPDAGDAITLPVPTNEVDNNENISSACPAGYP